VLLRAIESGRFDLIQAAYHAADSRIERSVLPSAVRHDVGVISEDPWFADRLIGMALADGHETGAAEATRFVLCNPGSPWFCRRYTKCASSARWWPWATPTGP